MVVSRRMSPIPRVIDLERSRLLSCALRSLTRRYSGTHGEASAIKIGGWLLESPDSQPIPKANQLTIVFSRSVVPEAEHFVLILEVAPR